MIADALKYLADLAQGAMKPFPVETNDPEIRTFLLGNKLIDVKIGFPKRQHKAESLSTVIEMANGFAEIPATAPVIWVNDDGVVLVIDDDGGRDDRVKMALPESAVFTSLANLDSYNWIDQKSFIRMLRIDLAGALPPGILLDRVRKLRFENSVATSGSVARDRESMGRAISSKVEAEGEIPEFVMLVTTVHEIGDPIEVACAVDVDASRGLLQLLPLPGEIERARRQSTLNIINVLRGQVKDSIPVYHGCPE